MMSIGDSSNIEQELKRIYWRRGLLSSPDGVEWLSLQVKNKAKCQDLGPHRNEEFTKWKLTPRF